MCEPIRRSCNFIVVFLTSYFKSGITLRNYLKSSYFNRESAQRYRKNINFYYSLSRKLDDWLKMYLDY